MDGDRADLEIEDFGLAENLMIEVAIVSSGCRVVRRDVAAGAELTDLAAFVECLADIARVLARNRRRRHGVRPSRIRRHRGEVARQGSAPYAPNLFATYQATAAGTPNTTISTGSSTLKGMLAQ